MGDLLLLRHGETEWSAARRHTSRTDLPLTPRGEEEARAVVPLLAGRTPLTVLTSPRVRAVATARLAGLSGETEPELREWEYGAYEGMMTEEIRRDRPGWNIWTDGCPPSADGHPGELPEEVGARADRVLARIEPLLRADRGDVLLVAHGHYLRVLTARRLGLAPGDGRLFQIFTGTVSRLSAEHGRPVVSVWNARPGGTEL
ncbi:histidine phosphatase family protein [Streptomyces abyssomicinicus]|uniref:histidine phosphatase family protein n=1 Tax=Streptomyces abyssomicinicus TaxID=574929 RepID=UPI001250B7F8|nr:histidine phosphatase family protein [Streptomyces abyssomicinicus]